MALQVKLLAFCCFIIFISGSFPDGGYAYELRRSKLIAETLKAAESRLFVQVNTLVPSADCASPAQGTDQETGSSLKVVHKHGPCYKSGQDIAMGSLNHTQILDQDQSRVDWIHARLYSSGKDGSFDLEAITVPAKSGRVVNSGNYIVSVGLGTPKRDLSLIFDTGSGLTWTQCQPCAGYCHEQKEPIFAPSNSSTYANVSCGTPTCELIKSATGHPPRCYNATDCVYEIEYGDASSFSVGLLASEKLTLGPSEVFDKFYFGCGQNNQGNFGQSAGLLGLARDNLSFVSQTAPKYGQYFSYCLPSRASLTGRLTFGKGGQVSSSIKYTPMVPSPFNLYFINTLAISVGTQKLPIDPSVFSKAGTIIDSGTVITRMPPSAYKIMRDAFRPFMSTYPQAQPVGLFDTCYDLSNQTSVFVPRISFFFGGNVEMPLGPFQILYVHDLAHVCLAFAANSDDSLPMIFGNVQQLTYDVVYDVAGRRIGFGAGGCL